MFAPGWCPLSACPNAVRWTQCHPYQSCFDQASSPVNDSAETVPIPDVSKIISDRLMTSSQNSISHDKLTNILECQNDITAILVKQQQLSNLPHKEIPIFSGDVLSYRPFIRAFEHAVELKTDVRSGCLLQWTPPVQFDFVCLNLCLQCLCLTSTRFCCLRVKPKKKSLVALLSSE